MEVKCDFCGSKFKRKPSELSNQNYCCRACYTSAIKKDKSLSANYKGGKYVKCVICGKKHYRTPHQIEKAKNHPCCSRNCFYKFRSAYCVGEKASNYKNALLTKTCSICNKQFETYKKTQQYCSVECKAKTQMNRKVLTCINCGKEFERTASHIFWANQRGRTNTFCSSKCTQEYHIGENNPNWVKDRSLLKDQNKSIRWSKEMVNWRKAVYKRDNYTCQTCGNRSSKNNAVMLNAHHIKKFAHNKELRFDVKNGITLCEDCHKKTYGKEAVFEKHFKELINV